MASKVCIITSVHSPFDVRIFHKEAKTLVKAGYDVTIIAQHDKEEIVDGIRIINLQRPRNRLERMIKTVWSAFRKALAVNADIYLFHDPELIPAGLRLKKKGKKVIYDVHEDYGEDILNKEWLPKIFQNIIARIFDRYEKKAAGVLDGIVTATPHIRTKFEKLNPNTIDINNYPILSNQVINHSGETLKSRSVNFVGAINRIRAVAEMVSSLEFTDAKLILAGNFTTTEDFDSAKSMKGWAKVDYRGQVGRSDVSTIFSESAAGLVLYHPGPNHNDSQPNKLFEYMAAGLPVIASNFPLWKEIVEKNKCGICVNPLNPREIADAINWVLQNPSDAAEMGKNGSRAALEKYNWETENCKLIRFYEQLLK